MKLGWKIIIGFCGVAAISTLIAQNQHEKPRNSGFSPYLAQEIAKGVIKQTLKDPNSAQFGPLSTYGDRKINGKSVIAVCGSVNARNGFGGYTGQKSFVFTQQPLLALIDNDQDNTAFVGAWNRLCAGKHEIPAN